jgi:hypothetical protein
MHKAINSQRYSFYFPPSINVNLNVYKGESPCYIIFVAVYVARLSGTGKDVEGSDCSLS